MFDYKSEIKYVNNNYWSEPIKNFESDLENKIDNINNGSGQITKSTNYFDGYYSITPMPVFDISDIGAVAGGLLKGTYVPKTDVSYVFKYLGNFDKKVTATHELIHQLNQREGRPQYEYLVEVQTQRMKDLLPIIYIQTY